MDRFPLRRQVLGEKKKEGRKRKTNGRQQLHRSRKTASCPEWTKKKKKKGRRKQQQEGGRNRRVKSARSFIRTKKKRGKEER